MKKIFRFFGLILLFLLICSPCYAGVLFNGSDTYISVNTSISSVPALSILMWLKTSSSATSGIADFTGDWYGENGGSYRFYFGGAGVDGNTSLTDGAWHCLVIVLDVDAAKDVKVYVDGSLDKEQNVGYASFSLANPSLLGASNTDSYIWTGQINEVAIWNVALTANEASILAKSKVKRTPLQIQPANLKSYYPFDSYEEGYTLKKFLIPNPTGANPEYIMDGNTGTQWQSRDVMKVGHYIKVDFGSATTIDEYRLYAAHRNDWPQDYLVQYSTNDSDWSTAYDIENAGDGNDTNNFGAISARYWRIYIHVQKSAWWRVNELYFKNDSVAQYPPDSETYKDISGNNETALPANDPICKAEEILNYPPAIGQFN